MAKVTNTEAIAALRREITALKKRVRALEDERGHELTAAIGFEVESVEVEDDAEYQLTFECAGRTAPAGNRRKLRRRG